MRIQNRNADELNPKSAFPRKRKPVRKSNEPELVESPDIESKMEARLIEEAIKSAKKEDKEEINNENIETNDVNGAIGGEEIDAAQTVPPSVKKHQIKIKIDSPRKNKAKQRNLQKSKDKITRLGNASKDAENISLKKVEEIG